MAGFMDYLSGFMGQNGGQLPAGLQSMQSMGAGLPDGLLQALQQRQQGQQGFGLGQQLPGMQGGGMGPMASAMGGGGGAPGGGMAEMLMRMGPQMMGMGQQQQQQQPMPGMLPVAGGQGMQGMGRGVGQGYMAQGGGIAPQRIISPRG